MLGLFLRLVFTQALFQVFSSFPAFDLSFNNSGHTKQRLDFLSDLAPDPDVALFAFLEELLGVTPDLGRLACWNVELMLGPALSMDNKAYRRFIR